MRVRPVKPITSARAQSGEEEEERRERRGEELAARLSELPAIPTHAASCC